MSHPMSPQRIYARDKDLYGSSRWANREYLRARNLTEKGKVWWGYGLPEKTGQGCYSIKSNTLRHAITLAPTRGGKLIGTSVPRCLDHPGALVVVDSKDGEICKIIAQERQRRTGRRPVIIDPWKLATSFLGVEPDCFNIFDTYDTESDDFFEDVMMDTSSIVTDRNANEPHWDDEAIMLILGLTQHVATCPLFLLPTEEKSKDLAQVRRLLNLSPREFKHLIAGEFEEKEDGSFTLIHPGMAQSKNEQVRASASRLLNKASKEFSGVISTAQQNTHFLESKRICQSFSKSTFSMEEFENGEIDIYIVLPAGRLFNYYRFVRILLTKFIRAVTRFETKPEEPILFFVEEMAALKRLEILEESVSLMAGYGIQLHLVLQDLSQLVRHYKDSWQTFIANSGVIQVSGTTDKFTASYISELTGNTSIETLSQQTSEIRASLFTSPKFFSREDSLNTRNLITPHEIMMLHPAAQILIFANTLPILAYKTAHFLDKRYRDRKGNPVFNILPEHQNKPMPRAIDFTRAGTDIEGVLGKILMGG